MDKNGEILGWVLLGADFNEALNNSYNGFWNSVFTGAVLGATKTAATMLYKGYNPIPI